MPTGLARPRQKQGCNSSFAVTACFPRTNLLAGGEGGVGAMGRSRMSRASRLETSMTKTEATADGNAFVTLRFAGDDLDPGEISAILPVSPTRAHRKGKEFFAGPRAGNLRGRTGMWFLATDKLVPGDNLQDHLAFVQKLLCPRPRDISRIAKLRAVLNRTHSRAHVTCFWRGEPGEPAPRIPDRFKSGIQPLAADIETDFQAGG
jgi:hypothetical protein